MKHKLSSVVFLVLICLLQDIKTFVEMEFYAKEREQFLKQYIDLDGGIPSHDTIGRAMGMINPSVLEKIQQKMTEYQVADEIDRIISSIEESFKLISIDGKTERGNGNVNQRPNHIVSSSTNNYTCIGQELTDVKSNEIMAIPKLIDKINIKGAIVTIDAMGTQKNIAKKS